jgi:hypothetical protein
MFFCDKCRQLFNISNKIPKQVGGKKVKNIKILFDKFKKGEEIVKHDLKHLELEDLLDNEKFEDMNKKDQKKLISIIKNIDNDFFQKDEETTGGDGKAYFVCKFCKNYDPIKPGTLLFSKKYSLTATAEEENINYSLIVHDASLPRTHNYICKNKKCETHKDSSLNEAVLLKNMKDQVIYVCCVCETSWIHGL